MAGPSYRFGPFLLDRAGYRAFKGSDPLELTPKLLDLLFYLADHSGTLVTKEALLDALWPGANVTENALTQAVSELRQALGDDAGSPQFIKTIARRGYRFIGRVETIAGEIRLSGSSPGDGKPDTTNQAQDIPRENRTVVVMDFANLSDDAESAWLSSGIAETVTGDLGALEHFRVVDRRRVVEAARVTNGSLQQVADLLNARLAVVGSYQRSGGRIRITARFVDVVSGEALADAKVDGPVEHIFDLQDTVVTQLARELGMPTRPAPSFGASGRDTPSLEAFRAFTEGSLRLETLDVRELPQAIADLERAVATDSRYALAFAGLASAELALYETTRADNEPRKPLLDLAVEHARHAVHLQTSLAEAHATLALVLVSAGNMPEAASAARRAVALEPSNWRHLFRLGHASWGEPRLRAATSTLALYPEFAFAHFQMAMVHVARGHLAEAETILRQGAAVQDRQIGRGGRYPALGLHWLLGLVRLAQDDVEEAIVEFDREERLAETHRLYGREYAMHARYCRALALLRVARTADAIDHLNQALERYPDHPSAHVALTIAHRAAGSPSQSASSLARARDALRTLEGGRPADAGIVRAHILTAEGDLTLAAATLQRLLDDAPPGFTGWAVPVDPLLRQLTGTTGFAAVLTRLADRAR